LSRASRHLDRLENIIERPTEAQNVVAELKKSLMNRNIDSIFDEGLHEFLNDFTAQIASIGETIRTSYFLGGF
jgi:uncharacterized alpha-E superfamily protein